MNELKKPSLPDDKKALLAESESLKKIYIGSEWNLIFLRRQ